MCIRNIQNIFRIAKSLKSIQESNYVPHVKVKAIKYSSSGTFWTVCIERDNKWSSFRKPVKAKICPAIALFLIFEKWTSWYSVHVFILCFVRSVRRMTLATDDLVTVATSTGPLWSFTLDINHRRAYWLKLENECYIFEWLWWQE